RMRVLAHHEVRVKRHRFAVRRQRVEGAHRHVELVGDAGHIDQHLRRMLGSELAREAADQRIRPFLYFKPWLCAWQMAQASASAASAEGAPGSASRRRTMYWTCSLAAWPLPTTDCFTCSAVYSDTGRPASTTAQIAVPRACPSASVDCGLTFTKTFSTATSTGPCCAITSRRPSSRTLSRAARSPLPDLT